MTPSIGIAPLPLVAIILFAVLFVVIFKGRVLSAIVGFGGLLLVIGGLLLLGSWVHLRPVSRSDLPRVEQGWSHPHITVHGEQTPIVTRREEQISTANQRLPAERPEQPDDSPVAVRSGVDGRDAPSSSANPPSPPRPKWMDAPMGRIDDVYRTRITVGPWMSRQECERDLASALRDAVAIYAEQHLGHGKGEHVDLPLSYIHENIVRGEWEERRQDMIDTMITLHALLEFDRDANRMIDASYQSSVVTSRLAHLSTGGGVLLGLLTIVFGYLRLDTLTRGYYTGRLRLTAGAAILALAAFGGWLVMP